MKIEVNTKLETGKKVGMFGVNCGTIQDLGLENVNVNVEVYTDEGKTNTMSIFLGGLCGINRSNATIKNCYTTGIINTSITVNANIAGLCGQNKGTILNCYNKADMYINVNMDYPKEEKFGVLVGGICGYTDSDVSNVYNTGSIYFNDGNQRLVNTKDQIGGIMGNCGGELKNSYSIGKINVQKNGDSKLIVGTAVGGNTGLGVGTIEKSYYLINRLFATGNNIDRTEVGEEKTESEMKGPGFVEMLNDGQEGTPWEQDTNNINNGFPILSWEEE